MAGASNSPKPAGLAGRQFDRNGNLKQWWNDATVQAFRNRTKCIIEQYSGYKLPEVGLFINGKMTQGENIADNGGLKQSFRVSSTLFNSVQLCST